MSKLDAALAKVREESEKSDLANLAHAILYADQEIARLEGVKREISALAEAPYRDPAEVRRLHDSARGNPGRR